MRFLTLAESPRRWNRAGVGARKMALEPRRQSPLNAQPAPGAPVTAPGCMRRAFASQQPVRPRPVRGRRTKVVPRKLSAPVLAG